MSRADANLRMSSSSSLGRNRSGRGLSRLSVFGGGDPEGATPPPFGRPRQLLNRGDSDGVRETNGLMRSSITTNLLTFKGQRLSPKQQKLLTASLIFKSPVSSPVELKRLQSFSNYSVLSAVGSDKTSPVQVVQQQEIEPQQQCQTEQQRIELVELSNNNNNNNTAEEEERRVDEQQQQVPFQKLEETKKQSQEALNPLIKERNTLVNKVATLERIIIQERQQVERLQRGFDDQVKETNAQITPEVQRLIGDLRALVVSDAEQMSKLTETNCKLKHARFDKDKQWLMELRELLQATIVRNDAEQASTAKRMEQFARTSFQDKKQLQNDLDSTRQLLTHVKLSLSESQRTVEELQQEKDQREQRVAAQASAPSLNAPCISGDKTSDSASESIAKTREGSPERWDYQQLLQDRVEYFEREFAKETANVKERDRLIIGKNAEILTLQDHVKKHAAERAELTAGLKKSQSKVAELKNKVSNLEVIMTTEREMNMKSVEKRDGIIAKLKDDLTTNEQSAQVAAEEAELKLGQAQRLGEERCTKLSEQLAKTKSALGTSGQRQSELETSLAELREQVMNLMQSTGEHKQALAEAECALAEARIGNDACSVELALQAKDFEEAKARFLTDFTRKTEALKREQDVSAQLKRNADQLSLDLSQIRQRQHSLLSEERELFQGKVLELEAALQQRDSGAVNELEKMSVLLLQYQSAQSDAREELESTKRKLHATQQELAEIRSEAGASNAFGEEAKRTLDEKDREANAQWGELQLAKHNVKTLEDFVQVRLSSSLGDMTHAQEAMEAELTCMTCLNLLNLPVLVLPGETRCCQKCVPDEALSSEHFTVYNDSAMDALSSKLGFSRQALVVLKSEIEKMEAKRKAFAQEMTR